MNRFPFNTSTDMSAGAITDIRMVFRSNVTPLGCSAFQLSHLVGFKETKITSS